MSLVERPWGQHSGDVGSSPNSATCMIGAGRQALYALGTQFFHLFNGNEHLGPTDL